MTKLIYNILYMSSAFILLVVAATLLVAGICQEHMFLTERALTLVASFWLFYLAYLAISHKRK